MNGLGADRFGGSGRYYRQSGRRVGEFRAEIEITRGQRIGSSVNSSNVDCVAGPFSARHFQPVSSGPDLANGESKFKGLGCSGCNSTGADKRVGPGLEGVSAKGDDYIMKSIVDPSAEVVDG